MPSPPRTAFRERALALMSAHPLIDSHVDLPVIMRSISRNPVETVPLVAGAFPGHVDVPRLRAGRVGGLFMSVWIPAAEGSDWANTEGMLQTAFEQLDLVRLLMKESDFCAARTSAEVRAAFAAGQIAVSIGVEGAHMLGNSLAVLRAYADLGVRYLTLTHTNHNVFASSAGSGGASLEPAHPGDGLSAFGEELVGECNRLGVMIDLSHVSDQTMRDALRLSRAPVIFSHSNARAVCAHARNVPDDVLDLLGTGPGQNDGVVQCVFLPDFVDPHEPTLERVADHIEYLATRCGKRHVGIASDFDGMKDGVAGLEDCSKYPELVAELLARGWSDADAAAVMGGNLLRVMDAVDAVHASLAAAGARASAAVWEGRRDLPAPWGGTDDEEFSDDVKEYLRAARKEWADKGLLDMDNVEPV
ncbi:hypothetical protein Q5752_004716 [Cryptotrichosporon argae]